MTKVCHMTSAHSAEDVRIFHKECVSLARAGYETYLVECGNTYDKEGVHIIGVGDIPGNRLSRMTQGARNVYRKALEIDADVYHLHDPELLSYGLKLKQKGRKVIFDSHEKYTEQLKHKPYLHKWCAEIVSRLYGFYEAYALRHIDGVIFPCLKNGKHPFEGLCKHITTINNVPLAREITALKGANSDKVSGSVCYVGGLTENRGLSRMIKAAYAANAQFFVAGAYDSAQYQQEIEAMPEYQCVVYRGLLNRGQVCDLLSRCEIGMAVLLNVGQYNQYDNFATKVYEYMAAGLPVILSDSPYNRKIIQETPFGICVNPDNVDEISSAIRYLLDHPEIARQMGKNGRKLIDERFNWEVEAERLTNFYETIMTD